MLCIRALSKRKVSILESTELDLLEATESQFLFPPISHDSQILRLKSAANLGATSCNKTILLNDGVNALLQSFPA